MAIEKYFSVLVILICCSWLTEGAVVANFTIYFEYVSTDEIVMLQNAIEDTGYIDTMQVQPISLLTDDVPPPPLNITTRVISKTTIELSWSHVRYNFSGYPVRGYSVFYKRYQPSIQTYWQKRTVSNPAVTKLNVTYLQQFTLYTFRVLAFTSGGNGVASNFADEKTGEGVPSEAPLQFRCIAESPTRISLTWDFLDGGLWNGFEYAYVIQYRPYRDTGNTTDIYVSSSTKSYVLDNLMQFTHYEIFLRASTRIGVGVRNWCTEWTEEGVPSVGPVITSWNFDPIRPLEALITWDPLPNDVINGDLQGYALYHGQTKMGKNAIEYPEMTKLEFDKFTLRYLLKGLEIYTQTKVVVKGYTNVGEGKESIPAYIETCQCPTHIFAAWFEKKPYLTVDGNGKVTGIFPNYLEEMIGFLCGKCTGSIKPTLYWDRTKTGHSPVRENEEELKKLVSNNAHVHVAMFGRSEIETFQSAFRYVSVVPSPGIAFIARDPLAELDKTATIMNSLAGCWPAIIIIFLFSVVAGIFVWIADCQVNEEEFPGESFIRGIYHGAYWAFVSMTTVGYGDKTPRSFMAKIIAIIWMLMGPIINGIVVGAITTSLTTINLEEDPKIYGTKVAALQGTFEFNLGVRRNAKMDNGVNYTKKGQMLDDLANRVVDGVLLDSIEAADMYDTIAEKKLKIIKLIPERSGWGIILSGEFLRLEDEIRSYVKTNEERTKKIVANATGKMAIGAQPPSNLDTGIVDPKSRMFKDFVMYGLIMYVILSIFGLTFEHGFLRMRKRRVVPSSQEHRSLLEENLATCVTDFCTESTEMVQSKSDDHESELKKLFWKKGYSFGVDGWFREKTNNENMLKNKIRYHEIMFKDLGYYDQKHDTPLFPKGKNVIRVAPVRNKSSNHYNESNA